MKETPYKVVTVCNQYRQPMYWAVERAGVCIARFDKKDPADACLQMCEEAWMQGAADGAGAVELYDRLLKKAGFRINAVLGRIEPIPAAEPAPASDGRAASRDPERKRRREEFKREAVARIKAGESTAEQEAKRAKAEGVYSANTFTRDVAWSLDNAVRKAS